MMKPSLLLLAWFLACFACFAQTDKVSGELSTTDTAELSILNIYPDSFPGVSIVFRAETRSGEPVWDLTKEKMIVKENTASCEVISLEPVSRNKPINIGIVLDHSQSMQIDMLQLYDSTRGLMLGTYDDHGNLIYPSWHIPPIDRAKSSVKNFVSSFNAQKDYISIVGFSTRVDTPLTLTRDTAAINAKVEAMEADSATALYDGMLAGIEEIKNGDGVNVLVVLTDGQDNMSKSSWNDVVTRANEYQIPVYIIGLGNVQKETLQQIADLTNGQFYFTKSSASLNNMYELISKQVQAFYNLVYRSSNFAAADSLRTIELSFDIDSIYLLTKPAILRLPHEVVEFMEKKEKEKEYMLAGGIAAAVLAGAGTLLIFFRRKRKPGEKSAPVIQKLFPNPARGVINAEHTALNGQLQIFNTTGQLVKTFDVQGVTRQFDVSDVIPGTYLATILTDEGARSNAVRFMVKR